MGPHSRGAMRPRFCHLPPQKRGRRKRRVPAAPAASRAVKKAHEYFTTGSPNSPAFPAQWCYGLFRALPGEPGFLATVAREKIPANLTPASGCQDHTALPSAEEFAGDGSGIVPGSTNSRGFMLQFRRERWFDSGLRVIDVRLAYDSPPASIFAASQPSIVARRSSLATEPSRGALSPRAPVPESQTPS